MIFDPYEDKFYPEFFTQQTLLNRNNTLYQLNNIDTIPPIDRNRLLKRLECSLEEAKDHWQNNTLLIHLWMVKLCVKDAKRQRTAERSVFEFIKSYGLDIKKPRPAMYLDRSGTFSKNKTDAAKSIDAIVTNSIGEIDFVSLKRIDEPGGMQDSQRSDVEVLFLENGINYINHNKNDTTSRFIGIIDGNYLKSSLASINNNIPEIYKQRVFVCNTWEYTTLLLEENDRKLHRSIFH